VRGVQGFADGEGGEQGEHICLHGLDEQLEGGHDDGEQDSHDPDGGTFTRMTTETGHSLTSFDERWEYGLERLLDSIQANLPPQ
jgi:hypothetical protein